MTDTQIWVFAVILGLSLAMNIILVYKLHAYKEIFKQATEIQKSCDAEEYEYPIKLPEQCQICGGEMNQNGDCKICGFNPEDYRKNNGS